MSQSSGESVNIMFDSLSTAVESHFGVELLLSGVVCRRNGTLVQPYYGGPY